jgi:hypothetical protein
VGGHQAVARQTIELGSLDIEIDQDSLSAFVQSSAHVAQLDKLIAKSMNGTVRPGVDDEFIGRQVAELVGLNFYSIADLNNYVQANWDLLGRFLEHRLSLIHHTPRSGRTPVPRGIALYYVGMLRYAQDLLAGRDVRSAFSGTNPDGVVESLLSASSHKAD